MAEIKIPSVSVVIPVFNRSEPLRRAIASVLRQTVQDLEVIVVDDGSTDAPDEVIRSFRDERIRYIRLEKKANGNVARNAGIKAAAGEFVAMLDSDDEWLPLHLERKLSLIGQSGSDGIFGSARIFDGEIFRVKISRPLEEGEKMVNYLLGGGFAQTSSHFYRKSAISKVLFDEELKRHQDFDLCVRFAAAYRFIADAEITVVINWGRDLSKKIDYASQISFIKKYEKDITPFNYSRYHIIMYRKAVNAGAEVPVLKHYWKESVRYIKYISLADFMTLRSPATVLGKINARLSFALRILLAKNN